MLNCQRMGAQTATRDESRLATVTSDAPIGQTFRVGPEVHEVARIAVYQQFWDESWQPDENLVLTLWDSPQRQVALGRDSIPYERRIWESALSMFTLEAPVEPDREYYFELTVELTPPRLAVTPREWQVARKRPGFAGGDGTINAIGIASDAYDAGVATLGGNKQEYDLLFQVHVRHRVDRDALYQEAFARFNLDYPPLASVRAAVLARDWDRAVLELVRHFESREDLLTPQTRTPGRSFTYDTREADLAAQHRVLLDDRSTSIDIGPNWNYFQNWPERGGVGLTRGGMRKPLGEAYLATGNPKYAYAFNDMVRRFYLDYPSPLRAGLYKEGEEIRSDLPPGLAGGSVWSALSIGARMLHGFHYYSIFSGSNAFTQDVRAMWIINLGEMADVLAQMKGYGNWATQMASALFQFGEKFPEYRRSRDWFKKGFDGLVVSALESVRPDGVLREPTSNYHNLVLNRYSGAMQHARRLKLEVPAKMASLVEKMMDFQMYSTLPDGTQPVWGDTFYPMRPELLERGAELFDRPDMLYVATGGAKGTRPAHTSYAFPDGGFYYMRSSWDRDAHYIGLRCGPYGSHGHSDSLSILASAYGTDILIDPGVLTYGSPEARELHATASHNTVTVDDRDAHPARPVAWVSRDTFDYFAGQGAGYRDLLTPVTRRVWFLKPMGSTPAMWVVFDDVGAPRPASRPATQTASQPEIPASARRLSLRYRFAQLPVQTDGQRDVWSAGPEGNLLIRLIDANPAKLTLRKAIADRKGMTEVPLAIYEKLGLPGGFTTVMAPFKGPQPPRCDTTLLTARGLSDTGRAVWFERDEDAVVLVLNGNGTRDDSASVSVETPAGILNLRGAGCAVRFAKTARGHNPVSICGLWLREATLAGKPLVPAREPADALEQILR